MKGLLSFTFFIISAVAFAQNPGVKSFSTDTADVLSYRYLPFGDDSYLKLKQPEIQLDDQFYSILQVPNLENRYTEGSLLIKRPAFIPEMPVAPTDPFSDFYLLDLDTEVIPTEKE